MTDELKKDINELVGKSKVVYVSSVDSEGYPETKAMFTMKRDGLHTHYFSTNTSSRRAKQFQDNSHACIYFTDNDIVAGFMLVGNIKVCTDHEHKEMLWFPGAEMYYPKGVDDEDYCVYEFTAEWGNYYHGLHNINFKIDELE